MIGVTAAAGRLAGSRVPWPEHVPPSDATPVAAWLAGKGRTGTPPSLHSTSSGAVRVCDAASAAGLSISGTFFYVGGEPFTAAKRARIEAAGCRGASAYSMAEIGNIGLPCAKGQADDENHVLEGKLAVQAREKTLVSGERVDALYLTSLSALTSKFMLNVESGDHATLERRGCDCAFGALGYTQRLSHIRSYEKLTGEGMTFIAADLLRLLEHELPVRFGGRSTDYQLAEEERDGHVRLDLVIAPQVGPLPEDEVTSYVLAQLRGSGRAEQMMSDIWRYAGTLSIVRREPHVTTVGKTPALRILPRA
jgi:phenylacetate-coenzyme A ligase PaaK-like adenylate-forming protein